MDTDATAKIRELRAKAERARRHAVGLGDDVAVPNLIRCAEQLEAEAVKLEAERHSTISVQVVVAPGEQSTTETLAAFEPSDGRSAALDKSFYSVAELFRPSGQHCMRPRSPNADR